jgi:hypothetical protein
MQGQPSIGRPVSLLCMHVISDPGQRGEMHVVVATSRAPHGSVSRCSAACMAHLSVHTVRISDIFICLDGKRWSLTRDWSEKGGPGPEPDMRTCRVPEPSDHVG